MDRHVIAQEVNHDKWRLYEGIWGFFSSLQCMLNLFLEIQSAIHSGIYRYDPDFAKRGCEVGVDGTTGYSQCMVLWLNLGLTFKTFSLLQIG